MRGLRNILRGLFLVGCFTGIEQLPVTRSIDDATLREAIAQERAIIEVTATWCVPCKLLEPHYAATARAHPGTPFFILDIDSSPNAADALGVTSVPTVLLFEKGQERARMSDLEGPDPRSIRTGLERLVHADGPPTDIAAQ